MEGSAGCVGPALAAQKPAKLFEMNILSRK
jgi:hypothetical protein